MERPLLLDTCAAMWLMANEDMTDEAVAAIDESGDADVPLYVSPITAWEIGNMARKARFKATLSPWVWFERLRQTPGIRLCELSPEILLESAMLPGPIPKDPADRIIAATARDCGFTVVTRDRSLLDYAAEGHLSAVEC